MTLADGKIMTADLIVGADGIHSSAVKEVTGYENPAVPTGISCFRCLMPVKEIQDDPECAFLMKEMEGKLSSFVSPKNGHQRIVWYPCREYVMIISSCKLRVGDSLLLILTVSTRNQVLNVAFICLDKEELKATEGKS